MYVVEIDAPNNRVVLGTKEDLKKQQMVVKNPNLIKYAEIPEDIDVVTKIRYKDKGTLSSVKKLDNDCLEVSFYEPVQGIAPGQSAVFYEGSDLLGGGFIAKPQE